VLCAYLFVAQFILYTGLQTMSSLFLKKKHKNL
jgi:hypothetical protein